MNSREHASAVRYAFVTANVCKALQRVETKQALTESDQRALGFGADLIHEALQGALWVYGTADEHGLHYEASSISVARRALSTLQALQLVSKREQIQPILSDMEGELRDLANKHAPRLPQQSLQNFFRMLSESLSSETVATSFGDSLERSEPRRQIAK